jgi:hypothetical protein
MKTNRVFLFFILLLTVISCDVMQDYSINGVNIDHTFGSMSEAWEWTANNIQYEVYNYWPRPERVYNGRKGDCQGYSVLLGYFLTKLGYEVEFIVFDLNKYYGIPSSGILHVGLLIKDTGQIIEPQISYYVFDTSRISVIARYDMRTILSMGR